MSKNIIVLGSTGSIGTQSLLVCKKLDYRVKALTAHQNADLLEKQAREFKPDLVVLTDAAACAKLRVALSDTKIKVEEGSAAVAKAAALPGENTVINSLIGVAGLVPTVEAIRAGNSVALANKETLVAGGKLVTALAKEKGVSLLPIDSEHSAILQCLRGNVAAQVSKLIITASGGPFFGYSRKQLEGVTKVQALNHPNWSMGAKITIDSSTLMNKGLELIEAMWLFGLPPERIDLLVHRQSIIHSMVEYDDGAVMAQLGEADMTIPIQYALTYPERYPSPAKRLNLLDSAPLTFEKPDLEVFTCLADCIEAAKRGGLYPCLLSGANEEAVGLFLNGEISYTEIFRAVNETLNHFQYSDYTSVDEVLEADQKARAFVRNLLL